MDPLSFGLKESTIDKIRSVFSNYPQVERVILYGSRAMGRHRAGSDIDLTMAGDITHSLHLRIENELDDILLPYKIDLPVMREIDNPDLLDHIHQIGAIFYERRTPTPERPFRDAPSTHPLAHLPRLCHFSPPGIPGTRYL